MLYELSQIHILPNLYSTFKTVIHTCDYKLQCLLIEPNKMEIHEKHEMMILQRAEKFVAYWTLSL